MSYSAYTIYYVRSPAGSGPPEISLITTSAAKRMNIHINTLRTGSFKLFKRPLPGFLTILTL